MLIVGVTGTVASGKTTVCGFLKKLGARIVDSDELVHRRMRRGTPEGRAVIRRLGSDVVGRGGVLDRNKLRRSALEDPGTLRFLERVFHPFVFRTLRALKRSQAGKKGLCAVEVPLLFETGLERAMDVTVAVVSSRRCMRKFAAKRGMAAGDLKRFLSRQWPQNRKVKHADIVIRNNGSLQELWKKVKKSYQKLSRMELERR